MTTRDALPELVRDKELSTTTENNLTTHHRRHGRRSIRETWKHDNVTLGQGGYGVVWLERRVDSESDDLGERGPELRAVKRIRAVDRSTLSESKHYLRELEALAKFSQDKYAYHFVKFFGWYEVAGWLHMAMEYCEHGDLKRYLFDCKTLPEDQLLEITSQVLGGLALMHGEGFAHRDLKPANILIKSKPPGQWWVKLADLGLTKRSATLQGSTAILGTQNFMAPETRGFPFLGDPKNADPFSADIWSVGQTILGAMTGSTSFDNPADLLAYQKGDLPFPDTSLRKVKASQYLIEFVSKLMEVDPNKRPSADEALRLPWIGAESPYTGYQQSAGMTTPYPVSRQHVSGAGGQYMQPGDITQASGAWTATLTRRPTVKSSSLDLTAPSGSWSTGTYQPPLTAAPPPAPTVAALPRPASSRSPSPLGASRPTFGIQSGSAGPAIPNPAPGGVRRGYSSYYTPSYPPSGRGGYQYTPYGAPPSPRPPSMLAGYGSPQYPIYAYPMYYPYIPPRIVSSSESSTVPGATSTASAKPLPQHSIIPSEPQTQQRATNISSIINDLRMKPAPPLRPTGQSDDLMKPINDATEGSVMIPKPFGQKGDDKKPVGVTKKLTTEGSTTKAPTNESKKTDSTREPGEIKKIDMTRRGNLRKKEELKIVDIAELRSFSNKFKLSTPVPQDLLSILGKEPTAKRNQNDENTKREETITQPQSKTTAPPASRKQKTWASVAAQGIVFKDQ